MGGGSPSQTVEITEEAPDFSPLELQFKNFDIEQKSVEGSYKRTSGDEDVKTISATVSLPESTQEAARKLSEAYMECLLNSGFCAEAKIMRDEAKKNLVLNKKIEDDLQADLDKIKEGLILNAEESYQKYASEIACLAGTSRTTYFTGAIAEYKTDLLTKIMGSLGELHIDVKKLEVDALLKSIDQLYKANIQSFLDMASVPINLTNVLKGANIDASEDKMRDYNETNFSLTGRYTHEVHTSNSGEIPADNDLLGNLGALITAPIIT